MQRESFSQICDPAILRQRKNRPNANFMRSLKKIKPLKFHHVNIFSLQPFPRISSFATFTWQMHIWCIIKEMRFYLLFIFLSPLLYAHEPGHFSSDWEVLTTRDKHYMRSARLFFLNHRRDLGWNFEKAANKATDWGIELARNEGRSGELRFHANQATGILQRKFSPSLLAGIKAGPHQLNSTSRKDSIVLFHYGANLSWKKGDQLQVHLKYEHNLSYQDWNFPQATSGQLTHDKWQWHALLWKWKKSRTNLRGRYKIFNDQNHQQYFDLDQKFKIGSQDSWFWLGLGGEYYRNTKEKIGYWTPRKFFSYGPRFEGSIPFGFGQYNLGLNLNRFRDERGVYGQGAYLNTSLQVGNRNSKNLRVGYEYIKSQQENTQWYSNRFYLNINIFL